MKKFSRILCGLLAVVMALSCMSALAFADNEQNVANPKSDEPDAVTTIGDAHTDESELDMVRETIVTPIEQNSYYKIVADEYIGDDYKTDGYKVIYSDIDVEGYTAIPKSYRGETGVDSEYGMYVNHLNLSEPEVVFVKLDECRQITATDYNKDKKYGGANEAGDTRYLYNHATKDAATVSNTTDDTYSISGDTSAQKTDMGTLFSVRIENGVDPNGRTFENTENGSTGDARVTYDVTAMTKTTFQIKATVPMYVCMYGFRGTGNIVTPSSDFYKMENYSTIRVHDSATIVDIVKLTQFFQIKDDDHSNDPIFSIACIDDGSGVEYVQGVTYSMQPKWINSTTAKYIWWYTQPDDADEVVVVKGATAADDKVLTIAELKALGRYTEIPAAEAINASGQCYVCYIDNDEDGKQDWIFRAAGTLDEDAVLHQTVNKINEKAGTAAGGLGKESEQFQLTDDMIIDDFKFGKFFSVGDKGEYNDDKQYSGLALQVSEIQAEPCSWRLVELSNHELKRGELAMSIAPKTATVDASAIDLSEIEEKTDITARGWLMSAPTVQNEETGEVVTHNETTGEIEVNGRTSLPLFTYARMAGSNVNAAGCTPVVKVTYTVTPMMDADQYSELTVASHNERGWNFKLVDIEADELETDTAAKKAATNAAITASQVKDADKTNG